jgi:hypothetical protein
MKTKFKDTKLGAWLADKAPDILQAAGDVFPPVGIITKLIGLDDRLTPEDKAEALKLVQSYELELYKIEVADRDSARTREVEVAKTGKTDFMMVITGLTGLFSFAVIIYAVIWIPGMASNDLFIHLMGMIEGVVIGNIFAYYYGTSKSSADKNKLIKP